MFDPKNNKIRSVMTIPYITNNSHSCQLITQTENHSAFMKTTHSNSNNSFQYQYLRSILDALGDLSVPEPVYMVAEQMVVLMYLVATFSLMALLSSATI